MSTRFIRKRFRRVIPIGEARLRESHLARGPHKHRSRYYPLYETANTIYNANNLIECLNNWNEYSNDIEDNVKNCASILNLMASYDESTDFEINQATNIICTNVLPYVENTPKYERTFNKLELNKLQESKSKILDTIYILKECDRIIENFKTLNEKFNVIDFFNEDLKVRSLNESLYRFCDKIEDFNLGYPANLCVAMESALYALDHLVVDKLDYRAISEGIIDYYLANGGNEDLNQFAESLDDVLQKDEFLPNEINDYMLYIQNVLNKDQIVSESIDEYFDNNIDLQMIETNDDYNLMRAKVGDLMQEFALFDKAKEIFTKFKALPNKSVSTVKEAINALFVTSRLQDMKKNTLNALAIIFYFVMGIGMAVGLGGLAGSCLATLLTITIHKSVNKEYLQDALEGWTKHRQDVERRLKTSTPEERNKLTTYLEEVDKNINILTSKYESMRDETSDEISSRSSADAQAHPSSNLINPLGHDPLSGNDKKDNKTVKEEYEILNEFKSLNTDQVINKIKKKIYTELSPKDKNKIKHKLLQLLQFILFIGSLGIVSITEFPLFINIIILCVAWTLVELLDIKDKDYCNSIIDTWKIHMKDVKSKIKSANGDEQSRLSIYLKELNKGLDLITESISIGRKYMEVKISDFSDLVKQSDLLLVNQDKFVEKYKKDISNKLKHANTDTIGPLVALTLTITLQVIAFKIIAYYQIGMVGEILLVVFATVLAQFLVLQGNALLSRRALSGFSSFKQDLKEKIKFADSKEKPLYTKFLHIVDKAEAKVTSILMGGK